MHAPCKAWLPFRSHIMRQFAVAAQFGNPSRFRRLHPFRNAFSNFGVAVSPCGTHQQFQPKRHTNQERSRYVRTYYQRKSMIMQDWGTHSYLPLSDVAEHGPSARKRNLSVRNCQQSPFLSECLRSYLKDFMHSIAIGESGGG